MPRVARRFRWTDAACYHVLNRGYARETVFHDDEDRAYFLSLLARYADRFGLRLYHYTLIDNHFHLLMQLPQARFLSRLMAGLLVSYWHHYRRRYGLVGHLFQGRFRSPAVQVEGYLPSCGRYSERNPVEARLVKRPWEYRWSSCRAYAFGENDVLRARNPWYEALARQAECRQQLWRVFLQGEDAKEEVVRREDWVVGTEPFRQQLQQRGRRPVPRSRGRPTEAAARVRGERIIPQNQKIQ